MCLYTAKVHKNGVDAREPCECLFHFVIIFVNGLAYFIWMLRVERNPPVFERIFEILVHLRYIQRHPRTTFLLWKSRCFQWNGEAGELCY